jgi:hypothetical protein
VSLAAFALHCHCICFACLGLLASFVAGFLCLASRGQGPGLLYLFPPQLVVWQHVLHIGVVGEMDISCWIIASFGLLNDIVCA